MIDLTTFLGELWKDFRTCARKAIKCSMLGEPLCRRLEDKNVEGDAEDRGPACGVSEGSLRLYQGLLLFSSPRCFVHGTSSQQRKPG